MCFNVNDRLLIEYDNRIQEILQQVLTTLQDSNITEKGNTDIYNRFWASYNQVAKEYDGEFLEQNSSDMDIILLSVSYQIILEHVFG